MSRQSRSKKGIMIILIILLLMIISLFLFYNYFESQNEKSAMVASAPVEVTKVVKTEVSKSLTVYGLSSIAPGKIQQNTTQIEVLVQKIFVSNGQHVSQGDPLIGLSATPKTQSDIDKAKINMDFAKQELDRLENLRTQYLATNNDVANAKQVFETAEANYKILENELENETSGVQKSTCNCNIVTVNVQPGQIVSPGTTLLTYAETNEVIVRLGVEYEDLSRIHVKQKVIITPIYNNKIQYTGVIENITNQINPQSGLIDVIVPLGNAKELISGSMVKGQIIVEQGKSALTIPESAVLYEKTQPYVFVDADGFAEKRYIIVGEKYNGAVEVFGGLNENEWVVTLGNYELQNGMKLRIEKK